MRPVLRFEEAAGQRLPLGGVNGIKSRTWDSATREKARVGQAHVDASVVAGGDHRYLEHLGGSLAARLSEL